MAVLIVHTNAVEGREEEFNEWYNTTHLNEILALPGFVGAHRYRIADTQFAPLTTYRYLTVFEIDGDPGPAIEAMRAASQGELNISEALDPELLATVYEPICDRVAHESAQPAH